jgi:acetylornithine/N-succinyldiaminopimelate aminotransferase
MSNIKELDKQYIMNTYGRHDLTVDHGEGCYLYGDDGRKYLDFGSGIGTLSLGTADKGYIDAITMQLTKTQHVSNYFTCEPVVRLAEKICNLSGYSKVFFANSGAEANEGAIKLARKYSYDKYGKGRSTIITFNSSFHGRTVTTLAATGQDVFHDFFFPFTEGFKYSPYNDKEALLANLTDDVCAVMFECVQGEGGVNPMTDEFALFLQDECSKRDILLIDGEIQAGVARTGMLFAYETLDIKPDVFTLAKGLCGGMPCGAFVANEKCGNVLTKGQHGSTFGGNPVSCAAGNYVLDVVSTEEFLLSVREKGEYLRNALLSLGKDTIVEVRGKGLMIGIKTTLAPGEVSVKALEKGLIVLTAGKDVVRLLPPLVITKEEIDEGVKILAEIF